MPSPFIDIARCEHHHREGDRGGGPHECGAQHIDGDRDSEGGRPVAHLSHEHPFGADRGHEKGRDPKKRDVPDNRGGDLDARPAPNPKGDDGGREGDRQRKDHRIHAGSLPSAVRAAFGGGSVRVIASVSRVRSVLKARNASVRANAVSAKLMTIAVRIKAWGNGLA